MILLVSVHPETPIKIPKLKLWTPNNGHLGIQSFSFGSVSGWTLVMNKSLKDLRVKFKSILNNEY